MVTARAGFLCNLTYGFNDCPLDVLVVGGVHKANG